MKKIRKISTIFLCLLMVAAVFAAVSMNVFAEDTCGTTGIQQAVGEFESDIQIIKGGTFLVQPVEPQYDNGKPVIRLFSTTWCPHCIWIKDTFDTVVNEYVQSGQIVAYHWEVDTGDNTLTSQAEMEVPLSELEILWTFNPKGSVPTFVFGEKYWRIGNGYELLNDLSAEEFEFRAIIEELISKEDTLEKEPYNPKPDFNNINVKDVKNLIDSNKDIIILDVRTSSDYESGHIANAISIPLFNLNQRINELDKEELIIIYCQGGSRSEEAYKILVENGFTNVQIMTGGIDAWIFSGYEITKNTVKKSDSYIEDSVTDNSIEQVKDSSAPNGEIPSKGEEWRNTILFVFFMIGIIATIIALFLIGGYKNNSRINQRRKKLASSGFKSIVNVIIIVLLLTTSVFTLPGPVEKAHGETPPPPGAEFEQDWQIDPPQEPRFGTGAWDVASDGDGNLYVVAIPKGSNKAVTKMSYEGDILTTWGDIGSGPGQFSGHTYNTLSVATYNHPTLGWLVYVLDSYNNCRIQVFDTNGNFKFQFGSCGTGPGVINSAPWHIRGPAISPLTGDIYLGDGQRAILRFDKDGIFINEWPRPTNPQGNGAVNALNIHPDTGELWVVIGGRRWWNIAAVARFSSNGIQLQPLWLLNQVSCPNGPGSSYGPSGASDMVVTTSGIYINVGHRIEKYQFSGTPDASGTHWGQCILDFARISGQGIIGEREIGPYGKGLGLAPNGNILHAASNRVQEWNPTGAHVRTITHPLKGFSSLVVDSNRNTVYAATGAFYGGSVIYRFDLNGHQIGYWTQRGSRTGYGPGGWQIAVDNNGYLYTVNGKHLVGGWILKHDPITGEPWNTIAPGVPYYGTPKYWDYSGALGELGGPTGVAVLDDGTDYYVYAADHNRITRFDGNTGVADLCLDDKYPSICGPGDFSFYPASLEIGPNPIAGGPDLLYVVDSGHKKIYTYDRDLVKQPWEWGPLLDPDEPILGMMRPRTIAFREHPTLGQLIYVSDSDRNKILRFGLDGTFYGEALTTSGINDIDFDAGGALYMIDYIPVGWGRTRLSRWNPTEIPAGESLVHVSSWMPGIVRAGGDAIAYIFLVSLGTVATPEIGVKWAVPSDAYLSSEPSGTFDPINSNIYWRVDPIPPGGTTLLKFRFANFAPLRGGALMGGVIGAPAEDVEEDPPNVTLFGACLDAMGAFGGTFGSARGTIFWLDKQIVFCSLASGDPNEKGLLTPFVRPGEPILYPIHFENVGDIEALDIRIEDPLDINLKNPIMVSPGGVYNEGTRTLVWNMVGRNLQVGEGDSVFFVAPTDPDTPSGTIIQNQAAIYFDFNPAEMTNIVEVIIDGQAPVSSITDLPPESLETFDVGWTSDDYGLSGVGEVTVYLSTDDGPFEPFLELYNGSGSFEFTGEDGKTYCFFSQARDNLSNEEERKDIADTCTLIVANQPPIANAGPDQVVEATSPDGALVTLNGLGSSDPNDDPLSFGWFIGEDLIAIGPTPEVPLPLGVHTITLEVSDPKDATSTDTVEVSVVDTTPPVVNAGLDLTVDEGSELFFDGSFSDAVTLVVNDPITQILWDFGDTTTTSGTLEPSHIYKDNGEYSVTLSVTDNHGNTGTDTVGVSVTNVAPVVSITSPPVGSLYSVGTPVFLEGTFTDAGILDMHTATWEFASMDTIITTDGTVIESDGGGTVSGEQTFDTAGVYSITLSVTDNDGGVGTASTIGELTAFIVVYDPEGGFVTGGGWFNSPAGAYAPDTSLTGKATFGFVSKYKKGADTPTGQTEFQFKVADLNFHSSSYEWLVVAGARAQYKGSGTINGEGDYGFLLTAIDGEQNGGGGEDKFRIKIWDKTSDEVIYDNQMDSDDFIDLTTVLGGGNIKIHNS